ncbi:NUDIX domain-containing protein [Changpingibacter yushuensis]|uniref:NUDIX domain-containing protein n=1 Tax=Changpingibacter yushuensis TaxID=2758440 RepID=UPI0015F64097|nr:NUDIX hydrolase [Changpingibacter yushuensis]
MILRDQLAPNHVRVTASSTPYHGLIFDVVEDTLVLASNGASMTRQYIEHDDAIGIVAVRPGEAGEEVLLIRQYRHPLKSLMWEIPAGLLDIPGEDQVTAAARELAEETDLVAERIEPLVRLSSSPGCSSESAQIFLATGIRAADVAFAREDEESEIEAVWLPVGEVVTAILAGDLSCPTLVAGVLAYASRNSTF